MSNTRNLADLLDTSGDIKSAALDNVTPTTSASDLTSGTLAGARIADDTITTAKVADGQITAAKVAADVATQAEIDAKLNLTGGTLTGTLTMESTDAGNSAAPELILYRNSASPASGDYLGQVQFKGENANGAQEIYAKVTGKISDPTHTSEDGLIETAIKGDGSFTIVSRQKSDELQLLNGVNLDVAGNIAVGGTVDGIDIATRDAVLTSTTTTAGAALPKAGGTMTGNTAHGANVKSTYGGSADLEIYHDGSHSYVSDTGTGNLNLKGQNLNLLASNSHDYLRCVQGGAVELYHNNVKKFETTSTGVTVTGTLATTSGVTGLTSAQMPTGSVLQVVHAVYDTSYYNANSASRTDISGFSATITPISTNSKVLIIVHASMHLNCDGRLGIARNGTAIYNHFIGTNRGVDDNDQATFAGTYLDSPSSTSAVVYQMYTIVTGCGNDVYINRSETGTTDNGRSGITLMEIAG